MNKDNDSNKNIKIIFKNSKIPYKRKSKSKVSPPLNINKYKIYLYSVLTQKIFLLFKTLLLQLMNHHFYQRNQKN